MLEGFLWALKRALRRVERLASSLAMRGWRGSVRHALEYRRERSPTSPQPASRETPPATTAYRSILVVEENVPDPTRDSGSQRLLAVMRLLAAEGWDVHLLCEGASASDDDVVRLGRSGARLHQGSPLSWLRRHGHGLHAVMLCRAPIAALYYDVVRRHAPGAILLFDTVDLHFLREQRAAGVLGRSRLLGWLATRTRKDELRLAARSDICLVVSEDERALLARELPRARIEVLSNIHEVKGRTTGYGQRRDLIFIGGFSHPPNLDAMRWFVDAVFPRLRERIADIRLHVIGRLNAEAREGLDRPGVVLHGQLENIDGFLDSCRVSVAPLRFGAGVKGKVNTAMSHGVPVVATSVATEGMHLTDGVDVLIADTPEDFANAVLRLYEDPELWLRLSDGGLANVERYFSHSVARETLQRLLPLPRQPEPRCG